MFDLPPENNMEILSIRRISWYHFCHKIEYFAPPDKIRSIFHLEYSRGKEIWENAKLFTCLLACLVCTIKSGIVLAEWFHGSFHLYNWSLWLYSMLYIYPLCNIKVQLCDLFETKNEIKRSVSFVAEFENRYRELFDKGRFANE